MAGASYIRTLGWPGLAVEIVDTRTNTVLTRKVRVRCTTGSIELRFFAASVDMTGGEEMSTKVKTEDGERPQRMKDWLIEQINSGKYDGLNWVDEAKTIFKVPWIHAKKRGYDPTRDAALFKYVQSSLKQVCVSRAISSSESKNRNSRSLEPTAVFLKARPASHGG